MTLQVYNSLSRQKEPFVPTDPNRVTMYVCGPTVYNHAHIGNARPAVVFDVLARLLRKTFPQLVYARNITDVEDKIHKAAADQGVEVSTIIDKFTRIYHEDMGALGVLPPDIEPRVTESMDAIISMIEALITAGHAYEADGHALFNVPSFEQYGALSGRSRDDMIAGARVEVAPYKKDAADFVLWKPSNDSQPGWDSPWGYGRPGWHVECSAMVEKHLGETIDIHGGGHDLQFPHHENEVAQSTCAHGGTLYSKYWMHNGFVNINSEKMSKSIGNVLLVHELLKQAPGEAIRLALLNAHYRQLLDWSEQGLRQSRSMLDRLYGALRDMQDIKAASDAALPEAFIAALHDDLNTPKALAELFALAKQANSVSDDAERAVLKSQLLQAGEYLGLLQQDPADWFTQGGDSDDDAEIDALVAARGQARANKDWAGSDRIRDQLAAMGITIEDKADGVRWRRG